MGNKDVGFVLATGAWHRPEHYGPFKAVLEARGYEVITPAFHCAGDEYGNTNYITDANVIHNLVKPSIEAGKEYIMVAHSYGGLPTSAAICGWTVKERAALGRKGGFRGMVWLSSFCLAEPGISLLEHMGKYPDWMETYGTYSFPLHGEETFYNDLPKEERKQWNDILRKHSLAAFETPVPVSAKQIQAPGWYFVCDDDQALSKEFQLVQVKNVPNVNVIHLASGHSPFLSLPEKLADEFDKIADATKSK